jgi:hypothetical protein
VHWALGEGQKPTLMMHYCTIEANSCVENQVVNAKKQMANKKQPLFSQKMAAF